MYIITTEIGTYANILEVLLRVAELVHGHSVHFDCPGGVALLVVNVPHVDLHLWAVSEEFVVRDGLVRLQRLVVHLIQLEL